MGLIESITEKKQPKKPQPVSKNLLLFKKRAQTVCANYRDITLLSLPGKVYPQVLERIQEEQEEQCRFFPGCRTIDQLFTLTRILEGAREFAQPISMCFVDLKKAYDQVPWEILWEVLREYGMRGSLLGVITSADD